MRTLIYHDIAPRSEREQVGFPGPTAALYKLEPRVFEAHLEALAEAGLRPGTYDPRTPSPQLLLSFDDGGSSALLAAQILERYGWRGQFFIASGRLDTPGFLSRSQLLSLAERGHAIGGHSHTHPLYMGRLNREQLDREWRACRQALEEVLGAAPRTAAAPGGSLSRESIAAAAGAGFEALFTSEPTVRVRHAELIVLGRYTIWAHTAARLAVAYARGEPLACGRLWLKWNARALAKRVAPSGYQALRRAWASRR